MEEIIIDGIKIYMKNGIKYRKRSTGKLKKVCIAEGCNKLMQYHNTGSHCIGHLKLFSNDNELEKQKLINEDKIRKENEKIKLEMKKKERLQNSKIIMDGIEIFIINNIKFRKDSKGNLVKTCSYENCHKFSKFGNCGNFCINHTNGTDPNDPERIQKTENLKKEMIVKNKNNFIIGEDSEKWLCGIMEIFDSINSIKRIGFTGSKFDIIYKINNEDHFRGIQVKTLVQRKSTDNYEMKITNRNYEENALFVGISKNKKIFVVFFYKEIKTKSIAFSFGNKNAKNKKFMFNSLPTFLFRLEKLLSKSSIYDYKNSLSKDMLNEYESLNFLKNKCDEFNFIFKRNDTNNSSIDCFINNYNIQCKTSKFKPKNANSYVFNIQKNAGKIDGKRQFKPYSDKDNIDFFILEIPDYKNNFYIIPIKILIQYNYIETTYQKGKIKLYIPIKKNNWTSEYLNNFDQLRISDKYKKILKLIK